MANDEDLIVYYPAEMPNATVSAFRRFPRSSAEKLATVGDKHGTLWLPVERQPNEPEPDTRPAPSTAEALGRGALKGFTFDLDDEAAGVGAWLSALKPPEGVDPSFLDSPREAYRQGRDEFRADTDRAREAHPNAFLAGEVAGGLATAPLGGGTKTLKAAAKTGAKLGAVAGAGAADEIEDIPVTAGLSALTGGALGAAGHEVGSRIAARGSRGLQRAAADRVPDAVEKADEMRALTVVGATGGGIGKPAVMKEAERIPGGVATIARVLREGEGTAPVLGRTRQIGNAAKKASIESRDAIQQVIGDVDQAGGVVDTKAYVQALRMEAIDLAMTRPEMEGAAKALLEKADNYEALYPNGATMAQAQVLKNDLGKLVKWARKMSGEKVPAAEEAGAKATRALTEEMDNAVERTLGKPRLEQYRGDRERNQVMRLAAKLAKENVERAGKNSPIGMMGSLAGVAGATVGAAGEHGTLGGVAGGLAALGAQKVGSAYQATARASIAEGAARMLKALADPRVAAKLGAAGEQLVEASSRGPTELAATFYALKLSNPDVAQLDEILDMHTPEEKKPGVDAGLAPLLR